MRSRSIAISAGISMCDGHVSDATIHPVCVRVCVCEIYLTIASAANKRVN